MEVIFRANLIVIYNHVNRKTFTKYQVFNLAGNSLIRAETGNWRWGKKPKTQDEIEVLQGR